MAIRDRRPQRRSPRCALSSTKASRPSCYDPQIHINPLDSRRDADASRYESEVRRLTYTRGQAAEALGISEHTAKKSSGGAKAMVVTSSRLHAARTKLAIDAYIADKGYR